MAAILAPKAWVEDVVTATEGVEIAAVNGPEHVVVGGTVPAVEIVTARAQAEGLRVMRLAASHAFHSHLMDPILPAFVAALAPVHFALPSCKSSRTVAEVPRGPISPGRTIG